MSTPPDAVMPAGLTDALSRMQQLESMVSQISAPASFLPQPATAGPAGAASSATAFQQALSAATAGQAAPVGANGGSGGLGALQVAESQVGVTEQPPGSNDGPQIAEYRTAVQGAYAGAPWCAYFASWCARQAGVPLGDHGQGFGSVSEITDWARQTGRLTQTPAPGELILFGTQHVGIVKSVNADGSLTTVEGNASNGVNVETRWPSEATGYVVL
jgi:CHAP domain-containing protein